jgi:hypothetical protein
VAERVAYHLKGVYLGGCSCDWGCPCNYNVRPSRGFCEGEYIWHVEEGHHGGTALGGLSFGMFLHSPAAIHLGNLTAAAIVDQRASGVQRRAMEAMLTTAPPFSIFMDLTSNFLGFSYAPIELHLYGIRSKVAIPEIYGLELAPMTNPVTGEVELATLVKPTGFTAKETEMCATALHRFSAPGLSYDHTGRYGEFAQYEYKG